MAYSGSLNMNRPTPAIYWPHYCSPTSVTQLLAQAFDTCHTLQKASLAHYCTVYSNILYCKYCNAKHPAAHAARTIPMQSYRAMAFQQVSKECIPHGAVRTRPQQVRPPMMLRLHATHQTSTPPLASTPHVACCQRRCNTYLSSQHAAYSRGSSVRVVVYLLLLDYAWHVHPAPPCGILITHLAVRLR